MPTNLPLLPVTMASLVLESCFYGMFLLLAGVSLWLLVHRNRISGRVDSGRQLAWAVVSSPYFLGTLGLTTFITGHWVMSIYRAFQGFLFYKSGTFPLGFFGNLGHWSETLKNAFFVANIITGDSLIIHRLWTVWGHDRRVVIFPLCSLVALMVCSGELVYQISQFKDGQHIFFSEAGRWVRTDTILTVITNVYCTSMISYRLWSTLRADRGAGVHAQGGASLRHVLSIVIESAALYTTWNLMFYIAYEAQSNLQFLLIDCWPVVTGISFTVIHARVGWEAIRRRKGVMPVAATGTGAGTVTGPLHFNLGAHAAAGVATSPSSDDEKERRVEVSV
ncbi:hypothetical protein MKEN_00960100 [Mycena kentingensis (nom. inval.)]|nr:hypothetical protein MKEN_00960100 [Mycena kentingensis (nom. inval.)]